MTKNRALFIDRDGVMNAIVYHLEMGIVDSPFTVDQMQFFEGIGTAIKHAQEQGFLAILISNQPGMAKDHFSEETFELMKLRLHEELAKDGALLDAEYYCCHHPFATNQKYRLICDCRKPKPGMILQAAKDYDIDTKRSFMIGDGITDIQAGRAAGCTTILIGRMKCDLCKKFDDVGVHPDHISSSLPDAIDYILSLDSTEEDVE